MELLEECNSHRKDLPCTPAIRVRCRGSILPNPKDPRSAPPPTPEAAAAALGSGKEELLPLVGNPLHRHRLVVARLPVVVLLLRRLLLAAVETLRPELGYSSAEEVPFPVVEIRPARIPERLKALVRPLGRGQAAQPYPRGKALSLSRPSQERPTSLLSKEEGPIPFAQRPRGVSRPPPEPAALSPLPLSPHSLDPEVALLARVLVGQAKEDDG